MTFRTILASCIEAIEHEESVESCLADYSEYANRLEPLLRIISQVHCLTSRQRATSAPRPNREFNGILAACLETIEQGKSVESCLATYPHFATRLEPLLRLVAQLHSLRLSQGSQLALAPEPEFEAILAAHLEEILRAADSAHAPQPNSEIAKQLAPLLQIVAELRSQPHRQMSLAAFVRGRELLAQAVASLQTMAAASSLSAPVVQAANMGSSSMPKRPSKRVAATRPARRLAWSFTPMLATAAAFALVIALVLQNAALSLPGDLFYPVKRGSEEVQGAVISTFGEPAAWHMSQVERRVQELASLDAAGRPLDPVLVEEVRGEVAEVVVAAAALPPAEREPALAEWFQRLNDHRKDTGGSDAVAAVLAEPLATAVSVLDDPTTAVALAPVATLPIVVNATPTDGIVQAGMLDQGVPQPTATLRPVPTPTWRLQATPTKAVREASVVAVASPAEPTGPIGMGEAETPTSGETIVRTATPVNRSLPTATSASQATATRVATSLPLLLATATDTAAGTPSPTPTEAELFLLSSPEPTNSLLPTVTPTRISTNTPRPTATSPVAEILLPTVTPTPVPSHTPLPTATVPTATAISVPTDTPEPTATATPRPTLTSLPTGTATLAPSDTPLPTATATPVPTNTSLPTATATPVPTNTPLPTATLVPTDTPLPTATATPVPTDTPLPTATATPIPTNTSLPTATATPVPTNTSLPTATATPVPTNTPLPTATLVPTDTPLPTATATPVPTDTPLPTATATPVPTNTSLPTATATLVPTNTPLPTATDTAVPTNTPLPTATPTLEPTATSLPTETPTPPDGYEPLEQ